MNSKEAFRCRHMSARGIHGKQFVAARLLPVLRQVISEVPRAFSDRAQAMPIFVRNSTRHCCDAVPMEALRRAASFPTISS